MGSDNPFGADNQQRSLESRLCWLGGIIDGEGMITAIKRKHNGRGQFGFVPRVSITNTDPTMIKEIVSILEEVGLSHHVQRKEGRGTWKTKYEVLFGGLERCSKALPVVLPYLVTKKRKAEKLLEFCESRLRLPPNSRYSADQIQMALSLRERAL